jgi:hypothetical protein
MSVVNIVGFETGDTSELSAVSGTVSIDSVTTRTGSYSLRSNPTGAGIGYGEVKGLNASGSAGTINKSNTYVRFYFRYATKPASGSEEIVAVWSSSLKFALRIDSAGKLSAYDATGTTQIGSTGATTLSADTWYRIEVYVGVGSSASWAVRIDGAAEISGTGNLGAVNTHKVRLGKVGNRSGQSVDFFYDDVAIDGAGWPGPGSVRIMTPNGDGAYTAWTGGFGSVDEVPHDGDTTFVSTSTSGDAETVALESASAAGISGTVGSVKSVAIVRDTSSTSAFALRLRSGTTDDDTSNINAPNNYLLLGKMYGTDPNGGGAWTLSALDALEVGVVASAAVEHRCTLMCVMVDFEPVSGAVPIGVLAHVLGCRRAG